MKVTPSKAKKPFGIKQVVWYLVRVKKRKNLKMFNNTTTFGNFTNNATLQIEEKQPCISLDIFRVIFPFSYLMTFIGNSLVVFVVRKHEQLHNVSCLILSALSIFDIDRAESMTQDT